MNLIFGKLKNMLFFCKLKNTQKAILLTITFTKGNSRQIRKDKSKFVRNLGKSWHSIFKKIWKKENFNIFYNLIDLIDLTIKKIIKSYVESYNNLLRWIIIEEDIRILQKI